MMRRWRHANFAADISLLPRIEIRRSSVGAIGSLLKARYASAAFLIMQRSPIISTAHTGIISIDDTLALWKAFAHNVIAIKQSRRGAAFKNWANEQASLLIASADDAVRHRLSMYFTAALTYDALGPMHADDGAFISRKARLL